jgi:hypothetical protein
MVTIRNSIRNGLTLKLDYHCTTANCPVEVRILPLQPIQEMPRESGAFLFEARHKLVWESADKKNGRREAPGIEWIEPPPKGSPKEILPLQLIKKPEI